jgi:hypothetical protein
VKASQLARGYLAIKTETLPLAAPAPQSTDGPDPDGAQAGPAPVAVGLRPLTPGEEADIFARARAYAIAHGLTDPKEGEELYEYGKALHRCLIGVVDVDSPPGRPEPFFDGGLAQLEGFDELGKEGVLTLAQMHQVYQDQLTGGLDELKDDNLEATLEELAGPHGAPFWFSRRPGLRVSLALTMARLLLASLRGKSHSTSAAAPSGTETSSENGWTTEGEP